MRDIKFRGIDNNKRWRHGFLVYSAFDTAFNIVEVGETPPTYQDPCGGIYSESANIIPDTIGQYTGFKDKNDVEIYEGDVLINRLENNRKCKVEWCEYTASFILTPYSNHPFLSKQDMLALQDMRGEIVESRGYEVVSNIHEENSYKEKINQDIL